MNDKTTYKILNLEYHKTTKELEIEVQASCGSRHFEKYNLADEIEIRIFLELLKEIHSGGTLSDLKELARESLDKKADLERLQKIDIVGKFFNADVYFGHLVDFEQAKQDDIDEWNYSKLSRDKITAERIKAN